MTTWERFHRMYEHQQADRIPIIDAPWAGTIARWHQEGMPVSADWRDYFGVDKVEQIGVDISPRFPEKTIEETEEYVIYTTGWGVTMKQLKQQDSTPEFLDFTIVTPEQWEKAKQKMAFDPARLNLTAIQNQYHAWRADHRWISGVLFFGFDVTHSWVVGTETLLIAMMEQPDWVKDMFDVCLERSLAYLDFLWDSGCRFDEIFWCDDMGYKNTPFFSLSLYRELLKPYHKKAVEWAHRKGIRAHLHSCGYIMPIVPELVEIGVDALNPIEIKAGMDVLQLKEKYGDQLVLHGGINAVLWDDREAIVAEIERLVPVLKQNGGYIFSSDHSIPNSVSLENFRHIIAAVKRAGSYES